MVNPHLYHDRVTLKKILSLMVPLFISGNNSALAAEKSAINDDIIIITGKAEATGITEDSKMYNTSSMSTATGLNLSARETPQSVSVLTKQRMLDQDLKNVTSAVDNITGISVRQSDSDRFSFTSRECGLKIFCVMV